MAERGGTGRSLDRQVSRRTFLTVAGASAIGIAAAQPVLAARRAAIEQRDAAAADATDAIGSKALELEFDQERIFRFVADEIRYEPYAGVLRGARGALESRAANAADQAALLAELLSAAAVPVRFRLGTLTPEQGDALLASGAADVATARDQAEAALRGSPHGSTTGAELPADARDLVARLPDLVDRSVRLVEERVDRSLRQLTEALGTAGVQLPPGPSQLPRAEAEQHVWVQAASGPEWLDLDPSMPDTASGIAYATATGEPLGSLPDALRHRVEFVVTTESLQGGALQQLAVIEHSAFSDELAGRPVGLSHEKPEGLRAIGQALESALEGTVRYQPVLSVGDVALIGLESLSFGSGSGSGSSSGSGVFGAEGSGAGEGEATAEWLDIRVISPERESHTRRTIFDRIGDEVRAAGSVDATQVAPVELVDLGEELTQEFAPLRVAHYLAIATGTTSADHFRGLGEDPGEAQALPLLPHLYHIGRDALSAVVGLPRGVRTFIDAPNVVAYSIGLEPGRASPGQERIDLSVDLLARSAGTSVPVGSAPAGPPGLVAGILAHEAERLAAGDGLSGEPFADLRVASVGAVFEAAEAQGVGTLVLRDPTQANGLPLDPAIARRLKAGLLEGWVAVIPERPVQLHGRDRIGWWLVDPATGAAIDVFEDGRGTALPENALLYDRIAHRVRAFVCLGLAVKTMYTLAELILEEYPGFVIGVGLGYVGHYFLGGHCH